MTTVEKSIFEVIKKQNGERFAKTIRAFDNGIFDVPNLPKIIKYAGRDAEPIMTYLESLKGIQIEEQGVYQHPIELLKIAGYDAYYADTLEKQNAIKKYFEQNERLCTFNDGSRYKNYHIINAVKHNVDKIKRSDNPEREDEYGTSVISIQALKNGGFISIKNRYNDTVPSPDNTFNSNPDNIIKGLSEAIKRRYQVDFSSQNVNLPNGFSIMNHRVLCYNYEINNTYFGEDFYAQNGVVTEVDKNSQIMLDYFILDMKDRTIADPSGINDGFIAALQTEIDGKKLQIIINEAGNKCLLADGVQLVEMENGNIVSLNLPNTTHIGNDFLRYNQSLKSFNVPNLKTIGNDFLLMNNILTHFNAPMLQKIGDNFLYYNNILTHFNAPMLQKIGDNFIYYNNTLTHFKAPKLQKVGDVFLFMNNILTHFETPNLETLGNGFLYKNNTLIHLDFPMLSKIGCVFLEDNHTLKKFIAPKLKNVGDRFLSENKNLESFEAPNLQKVGDDFLFMNNILTHFNAPMLQKIGDNFLYYNNTLTHFEAPKLQKVGGDFLFMNNILMHFDAPNLETLGNGFLYKNNVLTHFNALKLKMIGDNCLFNNDVLTQLNISVNGEDKSHCLNNHPNRNALLYKSSLRQTLQNMQETPKKIRDSSAKQTSLRKNLSEHNGI